MTDPITASRERIVEEMTQRFLGWKLPRDFNPDAGISYTPSNYTPEIDERPAGTNLFTATQAEAMVRFILDDLAIQHEAVVREEVIAIAKKIIGDKPCTPKCEECKAWIDLLRTTQPTI